MFHIATLPPCIFYSILSLPITTSLLVWTVYRMAYQLNPCCLFSHFPSPSLQFSIVLPHLKKKKTQLKDVTFLPKKLVLCSHCLLDKVQTHRSFVTLSSLRFPVAPAMLNGFSCSLCWFSVFIPVFGVLFHCHPGDYEKMTHHPFQR